MTRLPHIAAVLSVVALSSSSIVKSPSNDGNHFELLILHNNDMHARFEQTSQLSGACTVADREAGKCYGGFPRVAHVVKEARKAAASGEGPPVLYLNAGDTYTGTAWFTIYKWKVAAEFLNALQPDAVSLGNHEFDNGVSGLTPFIRNLTCPVLAANLILNKEPSLESEHNLMKSVVFNINGTKVGVIGYLTPETKVLAVKNNVEYIDEVIAIKEEVKKLKNEGVNILIALGHSGFLKDLEIAKKVEDIDLVIGGHTNTFLWNGTTPDSETIQGPYPTIVEQESGRIVAVVQAYAYTKYLGKLHVLFNSNGEIDKFDGNPVLLNSSVPQDPTLLEIVNRYRENIIEISDVIVGTSLVTLDGLTCRLQECNLGNLIADAIVDKYASEYKGDEWSDAPIAIVQGGGIRASVSHEEKIINITKGDLFTVMPFDGNIVKVTLNGSNVLKMLEYSVSNYNKIRAPGNFLQLSGLKVEYDFKRPPGKRLINVEVMCGKCKIPSYAPVNMSETYNILMNNFLSMGGDGFSLFLGLPSVTLDYNELSCTVDYINKMSPVHPTVEGRIVIHNIDNTNNSIRKSVSIILILLSIVNTKLF